MRTLLVANRGEIARRVFRTARSMGISTVAVFSDPDADAPHVREADAAVRLPGSAPADTYLRGDLIVEAAVRAGADAVHPGYGFLSEDAGFARAVVGAGLTWVGPPPEAVEAMGSKLGAKALMVAAGVPCLPGSADPSAAARDVGFPLLVKASAGGGGRGMRIVRTAGELEAAVDSASAEAASAFGDGTVFLERYVDRPRHVEVQVVADTYGAVVALFERDCSVQRRHQKVVEEAPAPGVDEALRARLLAAAVTATRAVDYAGVGTVEFVLERSGAFFFLEMNTRLQVEHPVTELVTGLDLVRLQLLVAAGEPLPPEVSAAKLTGHAVEARLYAEDAGNGFLPQTGTLTRFEVPGDVRVDSAVETGSVVGVHYDALLAKVVAHAPSRQEASAKLADALARARLHGVTTNRDLLVRLLRSDTWLSGDVDTGLLERDGGPAVLGAPAGPQVRRIHCVAAALAGAASRQGRFPSGWRNVPSQLHTASYDGVVVSYAYRREGLVVQVDGEPLQVRPFCMSSERVELEVDGVRRSYLVDGGNVDSPLGFTALVEDERFALPGRDLIAGSLLAPMPGTVLRVAVSQGQSVAAGDVLLVLEAMKMEHGVRAASDGTVSELLVVAGQQVAAGAVLAVVKIVVSDPGGA